MCLADWWCRTVMLISRGIWLRFVFPVASWRVWYLSWVRKRWVAFWYSTVKSGYIFFSIIKRFFFGIKRLFSVIPEVNWIWNFFSYIPISRFDWCKLLLYRYLTTYITQLGHTEYTKENTYYLQLHRVHDYFQVLTESSVILKESIRSCYSPLPKT